MQKVLNFFILKKFSETTSPQHGDCKGKTSNARAQFLERTNQKKENGRHGLVGSVN